MDLGDLFKIPIWLLSKKSSFLDTAKLKIF